VRRGRERLPKQRALVAPVLWSRSFSRKVIKSEVCHAGVVLNHLLRSSYGISCGYFKSFFGPQGDDSLLKSPHYYYTAY
jgi:hypothetical protein